MVTVDGKLLNEAEMPDFSRKAPRKKVVAEGQVLNLRSMTHTKTQTQTNTHNTRTIYIYNLCTEE